MTKVSDEVPIPLKIMIVAFPINILTIIEKPNPLRS
jgi:hypothetical protein